MKEYKVLITETLQKAVIVGAESEQEAHRLHGRTQSTHWTRRISRVWSSM